MPIRRAGESDLHRVLEVERLSFPGPKQWDFIDFREALKDLFLVFEDGNISGFLVACFRESVQRAAILRIAVHPARRNQGIATKLIEAAIETFREREIREVGIDVEIVGSAAVRLYERLGFHAVREMPMKEDDDMGEENGSYYMMKLTLRKDGNPAPEPGRHPVRQRPR